MVPAKLTIEIEMFCMTACLHSFTELLGNRQDMKRYKHTGKSKGVLFVQVLDVDILSDKMRCFTVTDGTFFVHNFHRVECEWYVTKEVKILVLDPSELLKKIRVNITVIYCFSMSRKFALPWCYQTIYTNIQL
jgi:hypothetical protein